MARVSSQVRTFRQSLENRLGRAYSTSECAKRAGLPVRTWLAYELGEREPRVTAAVAMAKILGVTVEQLDFQPVKKGEKPMSTP